MISMQASVRPYAAEDIAAIVTLSLRAWAPVFVSLRNAIGGRLFELLRGDWHEGQAADVRRVINDQAVTVWVAEVDAQLVGFIAATVPADSEIGEIVMVAVDPDCQGAGIGSSLTECATRWLRESGASVAMVETGGDSGHLAARRTYEAAGFTPLAITRYFKILEPPRSDSG
jgi:ribosomal protein S18 acetylase RimI-like enzyme